MTSISSLPRSSPTRLRLFQRATRFAHAYSGGQPHNAAADVMFVKANKDFEASSRPPRNTLAKQLFPSSSPVAGNGDIRDQLKKSGSAVTAAASAASSARTDPYPLNNRSPNVFPPTSGRGASQGSLPSLYNPANMGAVAGSKSKSTAYEAVYFAEDDFSDDENLDLDYVAPSAASSLPMLPTLKRETKPPAPIKLSQSGAPIPWSSSPASHLHHPHPPRTTFGVSTTSTSTLKRESSGDGDERAQRKPKKRVLPASFHRGSEEAEDGVTRPVMRTPGHKSREFWDPTASVTQEQKRNRKNQRQLRKGEQDGDVSVAQMQKTAEAHAAKPAPIGLSGEQEHILDLVVNKEKSVFFTGPAGTGKSVLMRAIIDALKRKHAKIPERVAVTASTGLAACNIGGMTLHSFAGIGLGKEDAPTLVKNVRRNQKAKTRWTKTKILVVDEISMVDGDLFDKLSQIGRTLRNNGRPWGGIQLVITGDFFQLPPVPNESKEAKFAFDAATWDTSIDHTIGLTQVFRQRDPVFAGMLNELRMGRISEATERTFKSLARPLKFDDGVDGAELFPTRYQVEQSNNKRLAELAGKAQRYEAIDTGDPAIRDRLLANMMAPKSIDLKLNAQVMLIKNLDETLVNGSLGKVVAFSDEKTFDMNDIDGGGSDAETSMAKARRKLQTFSHDADKDSSQMKYPVVQFMSVQGISRTILCQPEEWKVELPNGDIQAKRTQLPLILAWALSIHKAQGQTLERVTVNLGKVFEKGQAYVALSRATTQEGLRVMGFQKEKVMAHPRVLTLYNKLYSAEDALKKRPATMSDFVNRTQGASKLQPKQNVQVVTEEDEEAMASYGH